MLCEIEFVNGVKERVNLPIDSKKAASVYLRISKDKIKKVKRIDD